jgi:hypothetical protein
MEGICADPIPTAFCLSHTANALQTAASILPWREESDLFVAMPWFLRDKSSDGTLFRPVA